MSVDLRIPFEEFVWSYARSGGPGGQNVNKVSSKAVLRWPILASPSLPPDVRARFLERYPSRITVEGELVIASQTFRDQEGNRQECLEKLGKMLLIVARPPTPRRATKPTKGSKVRRVAAKRRTSKTKANRRGPVREE
ncbi:MAG: aminoacyl-tRNA hydrolase [Planctomycetes bacterium]|nr:aminoacyl-tRNA hydrolase [Planctomycetota bacterium]